MAGRPSSRTLPRLRSIVVATSPLAHSRPIFSIASLKRSRSSALSIASMLAPISSTPNFPAYHPGQSERGVKPGLAAHRWQQGIGPFFLDYLGNEFRCDRLDIGGVCQTRVGHDRRRVGVHQNDPVSLGLQRFAGLRAGIIKLTGLADNDRSRANDQDAVDICTFRHVSNFLPRLPVFRRAKRSGPMLYASCI